MFGAVERRLLRKERRKDQALARESGWRVRPVIRQFGCPVRHVDRSRSRLYHCRHAVSTPRLSLVLPSLATHPSAPVRRPASGSPRLARHALGLASPRRHLWARWLASNPMLEQRRPNLALTSDPAPPPSSRPSVLSLLDTLVVRTTVHPRTLLWASDSQPRQRRRRTREGLISAPTMITGRRDVPSDHHECRSQTQKLKS